MSYTGILGVAESQAIPHIISKWVFPALERLAQTVKRDYQLNIEPLSSHFGAYLKRAYNNNLYLNTIVFRGQQKLLRDMYVPLTLRFEDGEDKKTETEVIINDYPNLLVSKFRRILISDTAGMGKSTMTKTMFLSAIDKEAGIPFYVELRRLSKNHTLLDEIRDQLDSLTKDFDDYLMRSFFQLGGFIFFFDGFDEISIEDRETVVKDIKHFIDKAPDNFYILTSRPEQALAGFGDFKSMAIRPLEKKEAYCLLNKYDSQGETSRRLIEKLEAGDYKRIEDFLQNPLLVSLLFVGFEYKPDIPLKIHQFYDQVFEALFNSHDLAKDGFYIRKKKSGLEIKDFEKVLRSISFICLKRHRLGFSRSDLLDIITQAEKLSCVSLTSAECMMDDLLHAVPLFCQDGVNYKWVHKSLQEYFAADFINRDSGERKKQIINRIVNSPVLFSFSNLLKFFSDLDDKSFQQDIILPYLDSFISYVDSPITNGIPSNDERRRFRRQMLYYYENAVSVYVLSDKESGNVSLINDSVQSLLNKFPDKTIVTVDGADWLIIERPFGRRDVLLPLIKQRFPFSKNLNPVLVKRVKFIERGKLYSVDEELFVENSAAYDELNCILRSGIGCLSYEHALKIRETIRQQILENEDVFNGLLDL